MFLPDAEIESSTLRQGDILSNIHVVGALHLKGIHLVTDQDNKPINWTIPKPPEYCDVAVLSHSCEIDRSNAVKVTSVILAPIRNINSATEKDKVEELISSNIVDVNNPSSFLKYFYVEPSEKMQHKDGGVIDFSKCFSVRKNSYDHLLEKKVLQMKSEISQAMALKLALYFHRTQKPKNVAA